MKSHLTIPLESYFPGKPKYTGNLGFEYKNKINPKIVGRISKFIKENTVEPDYWNGVVVGISDGLDGATAAALCLKALGRKKVLGVITNLGGKDEHNTQEKLALKTAKALDINYVVIDASQVYTAMQSIVKERGPFTDANIGIRIIENIIFEIAEENNYAVVSTINKSEILTGRVTEGFHGHIAPLIGLYKTEIFDLAKILEIPQEVIDRKPGGVDTWYDEDTFGVTYDTLDKMLYLLTEEDLTPDEISEKYKFDREWIERLKIRTRHQFWRLNTKEFIL